jgi:hypothetical protein
MIYISTNAVITGKEGYTTTKETSKALIIPGKLGFINTLFPPSPLQRLLIYTYFEKKRRTDAFRCTSHLYNERTSRRMLTDREKIRSSEFIDIGVVAL